MPKIAFSSATRYILTAIGLTALAVLVWRLSEVFVIAFGGIVVATLLRAMAHPLRRFRALSDHGRVGIAIAALVLILAGAGWLFGKQITGQADELRELLPQQVGRIGAWLNRSGFGQTLVRTVRDSTHDGKTMGGLGIAAITVFGATLDAVLVLFLGVYFALDPEFYLDGVLRLLPPVHRERVRGALMNTGDALRRWLLGQFAAMGLVGVLAGGTLAVIGVPLALVLGGLAALFEFIPVVGPIIFAIPGIIVALSKGPRLALYAFLAYVAVQQLESNVIIPLLQRWAVKMPPVVGLLAVVAAGLLFGPAGIIFAAPLAVVVMSLVNQLYVKDTLEKPVGDGPARLPPTSP